VPWITQWFSSRKFRFDSGPVDVKFMVVNVTIPTVSQIHSLLPTILIRRTSGRTLGNFQQSTVLSDVSKHWKNKHSTFALFFVSKVLRKY